MGQQLCPEVSCSPLRSWIKVARTVQPVSNTLTELFKNTEKSKYSSKLRWTGSKSLRTPGSVSHKEVSWVVIAPQIMGFQLRASVAAHSFAWA